MRAVILPARGRPLVASFVATAIVCLSAAPAQASPFDPATSSGWFDRATSSGWFDRATSSGWFDRATSSPGLDRATSGPGFTVATAWSSPEGAGGEPLYGDDDPAVVEAKESYRLGSDAYALGNYEIAVGHFERAYELTHQPELLFNLGQSYTRWYDISNDLEHLKKARRLYENYVLNVGALGDLDDEQQAQARADAQRRITEVDRRIAQHDDGGSTTTPTDKPAKPVHKKAWFWVTIIGGLAVVGGVTAAVVLTTRKPGFEPELGTLGAVGVGGGQLSAGSGGLTLRF